MSDRSVHVHLKTIVSVFNLSVLVKCNTSIVSSKYHFSRHDSPDKMAHFELSNNQSLTYHSNDIYGYGEMTNSHKTIFLVFYCSVLLMNFLWYSLLSTQRPSLFKLSYHKNVDIKFSAHDAFLE